MSDQQIRPRLATTEVGDTFGPMTVHVEVAGVVKKVDAESGEAMVELTVTHDGAKVLVKAQARVALEVDA